jgi:hypothetical protein
VRDDAALTGPWSAPAAGLGLIRRVLLYALLYATILLRSKLKMPITERGQQLNVWMIVFTCLTTVTFVGRVFAYRLQKRRLRGDDLLITLSFVRKSVVTLRFHPLIALGESHGHASYYLDNTPSQPGCSFR